MLAALWPLSQKTPIDSGWPSENDALAVERRDERDLVALDELLQTRGPAIAAHRAKADQRQHLLALRQGVDEQIGNAGDARW